MGGAPPRPISLRFSFGPRRLRPAPLVSQEAGGASGLIFSIWQFRRLRRDLDKLDFVGLRGPFLRLIIACNEKRCRTSSLCCRVSEAHGEGVSPGRQAGTRNGSA